MDKHRYYLNTLAKAASSIERAANARVCACLVYKGMIQAFGMNQMKSHPFHAKFSHHEEAIYLHAETNCIYNSLKSIDVEDFRKSTLYVCRIKLIGGKIGWGLSKPCSGCMKAIATFNIKKVVYTNDGSDYSLLGE